MTGSKGWETMSEPRKLDKQNIEDILALTPMQEGMLFHYLNLPNSELYFEQLSLTLSGRVIPELLKKAWQHVADSNEMLRTVFKWDNLERPVQIILKSYAPVVQEYDFTGFDLDESLQRLSELKIHDRRERINIGSNPYRILLVKLNDESWEMIFSSHHIISDGWSNGIILKELFDAYQAFFEGREPVRPVKHQYKDYVIWLQRQDRQLHRAYWNRYLEGFTIATLLPADQPAGAGLMTAGKHSIRLSDPIRRDLEDWARHHEITLATLLYATWGVALQQYNSCYDVVFGSTIAGRPPEVKGIEGMVGLFINTLPLRFKTGPDLTALEALRKLDDELRERADYEGAGLVDIKDYAGFDRQANLFDSIVVLENYPLDHGLTRLGIPFRVANYEMFEMTNFDLTLVITVLDGITMNLIYDERRFRSAMIQTILSHMERILLGITRFSDRKLSELSILSETEKQEIFGLIENQRRLKRDPGNETESDPGFVAPDNEVEAQLAAIWKKVLKVEQVGTRDNFFDLGGNSISLMLVHTKIDKLYPGLLSGVDLFSYPTIAKLAGYILAQTRSSESKPLLPYVTVPADFVDGQSDSAEPQTLRFSFDDALLLKLRKVAAKEEVSAVDILLSCHLYLFTELSGVGQLTIQTALHGALSLLPVTIDLDQTSDFSTLFQSVKSQRNNAENTARDWNDLDTAGENKGPNDILPLLYQIGQFDLNRIAPEIVDLSFGMSETGDRIDFICSFNQQRLNKHKVVELIRDYRELVDAVVTKFLERDARAI
jgi:acyl carrier protein